jgi:hypothetical protein
MRKKEQAFSLPTVAKEEKQAKEPTTGPDNKATKKKTNGGRFIEKVRTLLDKEDSSLPEKLRYWLGAAFNPGDSQKTELFKKLSKFCSKYWKFFESISKEGLVIDSKNSKIQLEFCEEIKPDENDETTGSGCPDTVFVEKDGVGLIDITEKGISQAEGVEFQGKKVFVNDERDLANLLKTVKEILKNQAETSKEATTALLELQQIVLAAVNDVTTDNK